MCINCSQDYEIIHMDPVGIRQVMAPRKMLAIASLAIITHHVTDKLKINSLNQIILLKRTMNWLALAINFEIVVRNYYDII